MVNSGDASIESLETIFYIVLLPNLEGQIRAIIDHDIQSFQLWRGTMNQQQTQTTRRLADSFQEVVGFSFHYKKIFAKR